MSSNEKLARKIIEMAISSNLLIYHTMRIVGVNAEMVELTDEECADISKNYPLSFDYIRDSFPRNSKKQHFVSYE